MSAFSGINPGQFKTTVRELLTGATTLKDAKSRFVNDFSELGLPTESLNQLAVIGDEIERMVPEARRRLDLGIALERRSDPWMRNRDAMTFVPEPPLSLTDAQAKGRELAARMNALNKTDATGAEEIHRIAEELKKHQSDPEVLAAFFTNLGPLRLTTLPNLMYSSGSKTAARDLEAVSVALGVAMSAENLVTPGMDKIKTLVTTGGPENMANSWNKLALLQFGKFPTDVVKAAAANLVLNSFAKDPGQDFRGGFATSRAYDGALSENNVALALNILGKDSTAARDVLSNMNPGDYRKTFDQLLNYSRMQPDVADALGLAVEAAAGVHDETPGKHSPGAARFAMDWMVAAGAKGQDAEWSMKDSMAKLAISYKHELVTGARLDDGPYRDTSLSRPADFSTVLGATPTFYLGAKDTYNFLKTFVGNKQAGRAFDAEMGAFRREVLLTAAEADADAMKGDPPKNGEYFDVASSALGDLAGLEYAAIVKVRGDQDEFDKAMRGLMKDILTVGVIDRIPGGQGAVTLGWETTKFIAGKGLDKWVEGDQDSTRVGKFTSEKEAWIVAQRYDMAMILLEADYPADPPFPSDLSKDGKPMPLEEIVKDKDKLKAFDEWMDSTDADGVGDTFDKKVEGGNDGITNSEAQTRAKAYEKK